MRTLTEAAMAGVAASQTLLDREVEARQALDRARERLLAAMTAVMTGAPHPPAAGEPSPRPEASTEPPESPA